MCNSQIKYKKLLRPFVLLILYLPYPVFSQNSTGPDTISSTSSSLVIHWRGRVSCPVPDTLPIPPGGINHTRYPGNDKNVVFYDSLKARASKRKLMKKLYDYVIITPSTANNNQFRNTSDAGYLSYRGKKIRNIEIKRLNVFGEDINNPMSASPTRIDNIFNKTHVNTIEKIIRKNLLFSEGDTISPLTLSDNERILRQLSYIDDARIIAVPVSDNEADVIVLTKDVYSLGGSYSFKGLKSGSVSVFEKNLLGMGHELGIEVPYDSKAVNSPGFGFHYLIDNIEKSFINLNLYYLNGLGDRTYGFNLNRKLVSSTTKYAGGISVRQMYTTVSVNNLPAQSPLKYNLQDYWIARSFLINKESVSRIIIGTRYMNNNVFDRPVILPDSYYALQNYRLILGSAAFSIQKYYKTNLIYSYGRTEDIPYGGLFRITAGKENNEFKKRTYAGFDVSLGKSSSRLGYFYSSAGLSTFINNKHTEQGLFAVNLKYFSNLMILGRTRIRNFVDIDYTRGFDRNTDEHLVFYNDNGFSGFRNDSVNGNQRLTISLESVVFSPVNLYGFRFAVFGFADFSSLAGTNQILAHGSNLFGIGLGIRIRNDNLVFNTFQIRIGFFPNAPQYSKIENVTVSGEQLLRPDNFEPGAPSIIRYR